VTAQGLQQSAAAAQHTDGTAARSNNAPSSSSNIISSGKGSPSVRPRKNCVVCMDHLRDVLLLPCKHLRHSTVLCSECAAAEQMQGRGALVNCPYCRQSCSKRARVH
jgi:hypothetical protein